MALAGDEDKKGADAQAESARVTPETQNDGTRAPMSRRHFLLAAVGGTAAFLAACGRDALPTPAPTSTPGGTFSALPTPLQGNERYFPVGRNGARPGAATPQAVAAAPTSPVATPEATNTRAPEPTDTREPEPTATPTPEATPFPPGPTSKLGLFVSRNMPEIFTMLSTGAVTVVKTMELDENFAAQIKRTSPNTLLIGRIDLPQIELGSLDPIPEAHRFVNQLMPIADTPSRRRSFDGWEAYNEPIPANIDEMHRLAEFEAERTRLLGEQGLRSVVGNFGVGQPPLEWWSAFFPALQAAKQYNGWLGLHEYSAPTIYFETTRDGQGRYPDITPQDTGWLTLRYRKVYREHLQPAGLGIPLIFTELGVDGLILNRPGPPDAMGWQDFQEYWAENGFGVWGPGAYIEQLAWYDRAMQQDDYVVGGAIFAMASSDGWQSYDILGPAAGILQQYMSVHSPNSQ